MAIRNKGAIILIISAFLAGCTVNNDGSGPAISDSDGLPAAPEEGHSPPRQEPVSEPAEPVNDTQESAPIWASLEEATIRPGAQIEGGDCTANFVFTSMDYSEVYIGSAAHCFIGESESNYYCSYVPLEPGEPILIRGASEAGTLVYSSFYTMRQNNHTTNERLCYANDFALIKLSGEDRSRVNPALTYFGGPIGLANSSFISINDKLISFGNSTDHHDSDYSQRKEGYVTKVQSYQGWTTEAIIPVIKGDSGSAVIDASGQAVGLVKGIAVNEESINGAGSPGILIPNLDMALAYAEEYAGIEVRLATWDLLNDGILPQSE